MKTSLRRTWERVRTVPGLGRDLAALAVVGTLGVGSGVYMLAHYGIRPPWQRQYVFSAYFTAAPGVTATNHQQVQIAGVPAGTITGAAPAPNGQAKLTLSLNPGTTVYRNARLVLDTQNPLNQMYVELDPGGPPAKALPAGGSLPVTQTQRPVQSYETLDHLNARTQAAITYLLNASDSALSDAPADLPADLQGLNQGAATYQPVLTALAARRQKIAALVTDLSEIASAAGDNDTRLTSLVNALQRTLGVLASRQSDLKAILADLPGFTSKLNAATHGVGQLAGQLNPTLQDLHDASGSLPPALRQFDTTVGQLGQTVDAAGPVVTRARPVVSELRPVAGDVNSSLTSLEPVTSHLGYVTVKAVPWMNDLAAFMYNDASMFSNYDVNGGVARGHLVNDPTDPTGLGPANGGSK